MLLEDQRGFCNVRDKGGQNDPPVSPKWRKLGR